MGRRPTTTIADKYFEDTIVPCGNKAGQTTESSCKCCHAAPFRAITGTKKVAHLLGVPGQGITACSHSKITLPQEEIVILASSTKSAKEWKDRGAGGSHPALSQRTTSQRTTGCEQDGSGQSASEQIQLFRI